MADHASDFEGQPGPPATDTFPAEMQARLAAARIMAVITVEQVEHAVPLARALVEGGISAMELAWRTPAFLPALRAIKREVPEMLAGAGTLLMPDQVDAARAAGADFGVAPGLSPAVVAAAKRIGLPFAPGVMTPTDLQTAVALGCRLLKFFPAATSGGLAHLRSLHAPFAHLGLRYIVLGGVSELNAVDYLREPSVAALGGTWIVPPALVTQHAWDAIRDRASAARSLADHSGHSLT